MSQTVVSQNFLRLLEWAQFLPSTNLGDGRVTQITLTHDTKQSNSASLFTHPHFAPLLSTIQLDVLLNISLFCGVMFFLVTYYAAS